MILLSYTSYHHNEFYDKIFIQTYIMYFDHSHPTGLFLSLSFLWISFFYLANLSSKEDVFKHVNLCWCWFILCCYSRNPRTWQFIKNGGDFSQSWRPQIQTAHGLFVLVINSESPTTHYCHIKERNKSRSPWEFRLNSLLYVLHVFHPLPVCCLKTVT